MASFVFVDRQKNRQTDKQTGQNLYAPTLWILGKKKKKKGKVHTSANLAAVYKATV